MALGSVIAGGAFSAAVSLFGVHLLRARSLVSARAGGYMVALAGGIVMGASFLHLLPEAQALAPAHSGLAAVAAFLALYLAESHTLPHVHGPHSGDEPHQPPQRVRLGQFAALGFGVHAIFDGLALGAGARHGAGLEGSTLLAVVAHKLPEGMALTTLLEQGGVESRRALAYAWVVALCTPTAAVAAWSFLGHGIPPFHMGLVLAVVAGSFLYISASDLLPEVRRHPSIVHSLLLLLGVSAMWLLARFRHAH